MAKNSKAAQFETLPFIVDTFSTTEGGSGKKNSWIVTVALPPVYGHQRHCGLWQPPDPRGPPDPIRLYHDPDSVLLDQTPELTFVDIDTFMTTF